MKISLFITFVISVFFSVNTSVAQIEQVQLYNNLFRTADSLNKLGNHFSIDSTTKMAVKELDKEHPSKYFEKAAEFLNTNQFNDAAFLYYVGLMRYRYYNSVNPDYQASGDGALLASSKYVIGETVNLYLKTNIENFKAALTFATDYYKSNDYSFYSGQKNIEKYNKQVNDLLTLITVLETNKALYLEKWAEERNMIIKYTNKAIDDYNKMTPQEKAKLKQNN